MFPGPIAADVEVQFGGDPGLGSSRIERALVSQVGKQLVLKKARTPRMSETITLARSGSSVRQESLWVELNPILQGICGRKLACNVAREANRENSLKPHWIFTTTSPERIQRQLPRHRRWSSRNPQSLPRKRLASSSAIHSMSLRAALRSSTIWAISSLMPSPRRPSCTPWRSAADWFWLAFHLPSIVEMGISMPTMPLSRP